MTEIPEHLLKRAQAARSKASGDAAPAGGAEPSTAVEAAAPAAPAVAKAAAPAVPSAPPPPKPDAPVVAAYKARKKIPVWAMITLSILPVWMLMYVKSVTPTEAEASGPVGEGSEVYGACASCHGGDGAGGVGRQLSDGEVLLTFPRIEDQINFVMYGTEGYEAAGISGYGDPNREGGQHATRSYNGGAMPNQAPSRTDAEILAAVCYIRYEIGGADRTSTEWAGEFAHWCADDAPVWLEIEEGAVTLAELVGEEPREPLEDQTPGASTGDGE